MSQSETPVGERRRQRREIGRLEGPEDSRHSSDPPSSRAKDRLLPDDLGAEVDRVPDGDRLPQHLDDARPEDLSVGRVVAGLTLGVALRERDRLREELLALGDVDRERLLARIADDVGRAGTGGAGDGRGEERDDEDERKTGHRNLRKNEAHLYLHVSETPALTPPRRKKDAVDGSLPGAVLKAAAVIVLDKVTKRFGPKILFENVSMQFDPGKRYGLTGANGAGKSTLFKMLAGDEETDTGLDRHPRRRSASASSSRTTSSTTSSASSTPS